MVCEIPPRGESCKNNDRDIVLLLKNYRNREDSECTVIASGFLRSNLMACEGIASSHTCPGVQVPGKNAPRNDSPFGCGWKPRYAQFAI